MSADRTVKIKYSIKDDIVQGISFIKVLLINLSVQEYFKLHNWRQVTIRDYSLSLLLCLFSLSFFMLTK